MQSVIGWSVGSEARDASEPRRSAPRRVAESRIGRLRRFARRFTGRLLAVLVLCFATPGVADVVQEVVASALGVDCCDEGGCEHGAGQSCPRSCSHCKCCSHASALPMALQAVSALRVAGFVRYGVRNDGRQSASGHRTPPFRPPTA